MNQEKIWEEFNKPLKTGAKYMLLRLHTRLARETGRDADPTVDFQFWVIYGCWSRCPHCGVMHYNDRYFSHHVYDNKAWKQKQLRRAEALRCAVGCGDAETGDMRRDDAHDHARDHGASENISEQLGASGCFWRHMGASGSI